jgi:hypothetical protein
MCQYICVIFVIKEVAETLKKGETLKVVHIYIVERGWRGANEHIMDSFYPRVYVVYRRVYILLCCCSCSWEVFNQTCQYFGRQLIKHDQTGLDTFIKVGRISADS